MLCKYSKFKSNVIHKAFPSASRHQALTGSAPRLSTRGTSELPQQTTTLLFCGWCKNVRLFKQKLRPILRWLCWFKSSGSGYRGGSRCRKFSDAVMTIFSGQSVISRVYTSRFGNGTARWNLDRSGTKKVSGTRYSTQWKTPQKWTVPYRTVPCSWKAPIV